MITSMDTDDELSPVVGEALLGTLQEIADLLRSIEKLAYERGRYDDWWSLVRRMLELRVRVARRLLGADFGQAMEALCAQYDVFVQTVIPSPDEQ